MALHKGRQVRALIPIVEALVPSVLQMIPGMDENLAFEIVMTRAGFDGVDGTEDDLPFTRIQDLMMVPSITPPVLQSMRRFVTHRSNTFEIIV